MGEPSSNSKIFIHR